MQKLLKGEFSTRRRKNVAQAKSFSEMLEQTIRRYRNQAIEAAQVIEEPIALAKDKGRIWNPRCPIPLYGIANPIAVCGAAFGVHEAGTPRPR